MQIIRSVTKETFWQLVGKVGSLVSTILVLGIITRTYGETGLGINTLTFTYLAFFYLSADLGLNAYVLQRMHQHPEDANKLFNLRFYLSIMLSLLALMLLPFLPFNNYQFNLSVAIGVLTVVGYGVVNSANLIFQYNSGYKYSAIASLVGVLGVLPLTLVLVYLRVSVEFLALTSLLTWFINSVVSLNLVKRFYKFKLILPELSFFKVTIRGAWPIATTLIINTLYFRVDSFILTADYNFSEVGSYNLAYQVFQNVIVLPTFIMNGYYPLMLKSLNESKAVFFEQFKKMMLILLGLSAIAALGGWFLAPLIVRILAGKGFLGSVESLKLLSLSYPAFFVSSLFIWVLMAFKKYKVMFLIYLFGFMVNVILNLIFIPKFSYIAASWVTVICEYLILCLQLIILVPVFKNLKKGEK